MLLPELVTGGDRTALRFGDADLTYRELALLTGHLAGKLRGRDRVAVWATPTIETCVAVVGALVAGVAVVPVNPKIGERELDHIVADSAPDVVLAAPGVELPARLAELPRLPVTLAPLDTPPPPAPEEPDGEAPAFVVYTSGTTGPPKGVVLPRRAVATNLDALAEMWQWTAADVLVHGLPLFHVHGLILGVIGPLRRGGTLHHLGRFSSGGVAAELARDATMLFGVPTMYHRLAADCQADPALAAAVGSARLLVSGSAALPATDHQRITEATGQRVVERYGMTETLMNCGVRADGDRRPGTVGPPLPGVELRLVDDAGVALDVADGETVGEIEVRGPNLFLGYLNRPDATAQAMRAGWFRTGDMAVREQDDYVRIVGRRATDLIKSGGYKIGAGEIENALLEHPGVAEAAVTGEPDEDLGERIVAWVVPAGDPPVPDELAGELVDHVARLLSPHKRPRVVRFLESLPRNEMGKVTKRALHG
ncbi:MAG: AMP-binding protein [Actinophytocola sp.]|uniref:acyl-CoA synthetase n=1 Tax=Actinophytocola sp. TaxID=1872138 RepID=UPI00132A07A3|nr:acyl-CoA synthetase [Actinophytocola sp.]MPZ80242.1 AMP-binding protein [Actinophytocola sp.]